jgi:putative transposase
MALTHRRPPAGLLHHSDRGVEYASLAYRERLAQAGLVPSMSRRGNCYDNAVMESFWSSLKWELVHRRQFQTRAEAQGALFEWLEAFYNRERFHSALGYQSPVDFELNLNKQTHDSSASPGVHQTEARAAPRICSRWQQPNSRS